MLVPRMEQPIQPIVVIGASLGGVATLLDLGAQFSTDFDAAVMVTLHIDAYDSQMPRLMMRNSRLPVSYASADEAIRPGRIYFAPPDHHLLVDGNTMRLTQGAKENHVRPAIDPLFRSAALSRSRGSVIGVVLTGMLDDGASGLKVIKDCGGVTIVQEPAEAPAPSMPLAALASTSVDYRVGIAELGALLAELVARPPVVSTGHPSAAAETELALALGKGDAFTLLGTIGKPSSLTCPDCGGSLSKLHEQPPKRFRCHTGHAFTLRALEHAQSELASASLWATLRTLNEKRWLLVELADSYAGIADHDAADTARRLAERVAAASGELRSLLESLPGSASRVMPLESL